MEIDPILKGLWPCDPSAPRPPGLPRPPSRHASPKRLARDAGGDYKADAHARWAEGKALLAKIQAAADAGDAATAGVLVLELLDMGGALELKVY